MKKRSHFSFMSLQASILLPFNYCIDGKLVSQSCTDSSRLPASKLIMLKLILFTVQDTSSTRVPYLISQLVVLPYMEGHNYTCAKWKWYNDVMSSRCKLT